MMRIAMFFWSLELGGVEHMMVQLSRELAARGHAVSLVLARAATETEYLPDDRVSVIRLDAATTGLTVLRLARHLRRVRYDLVYTAMPTSNIVALAAIWLSRAKSRLVISERSNPRLEAQYSRTWRYRAAFALQRFCYPRADRIVAVSHDLADDLADFARLPRQKIHVIYNPAFDDRASVAASGPTHPWLDEKATPVILAAGRLTAQKDFATLIRAFGQLRSKLNVRLMILGEGRERQNLQDLVDALGLTDDVALPGFVPDIFPYLQQADVSPLARSGKALAMCWSRRWRLGAVSSPPIVRTDLAKSWRAGHLAGWCPLETSPVLRTPWNRAWHCLLRLWRCANAPDSSALPNLPMPMNNCLRSLRVRQREARCVRQFAQCALV